MDLERLPSPAAIRRWAGAKSCNNCGEVYQTKKKAQKYCSIKCFYEAQNIPKVCENCGEVYQAKYTLQKYCSSCGKTKKICKQCGKEFEAPLYRREIACFCSTKCLFGYHEKRVIKICPICNKKFIVRKSQENQRCCSRKCQRIAKIKGIEKKPRETGIYGWCLICNKKIYIRKGLINKKKYCSQKCRRINEKKLKHKEKARHMAKHDWNDPGYLYKYFKGMLYEKGFELNELDEEIIRTRVSLFKLKKEEVRQYDEKS